MALVKCIECEAQISTKANICPSCGIELKKRIGCLSKIILFILALPVALFVMAAIFGSDSGNSARNAIAPNTNVGNTEEKKPPREKLDYSKPIFTENYAIVCPQALLLSSLLDKRAGHGLQEIYETFTAIWGRSAKVKELGCEEWRGGIQVFAHRMDSPFDNFVGISLAPNRGADLFTMEPLLTNRGTSATSVPEPTTDAQSTASSAQANDSEKPSNDDNDSAAPSSLHTTTEMTDMPVIQNSSDLHCDYQRQCTDEEFVEALDGLRRQWALTPEWLRAKCATNTTFPALQSCIVKETVAWLNVNPSSKAPWVSADIWKKK